MRLIVELELENNTIMNVIANVKDKEEAKKWAIKSSIRLFGDSAMHVTKDCSIISVDKWSQEKQSSYQNGNRQYLVTFFLDNITQFIRIEAAGVKSAYNSVKVKYGIQENLNMMIYEVNQEIKKNKKAKKTETPKKAETPKKNEIENPRLSAMNMARDLLPDINKVNYILNKANEKTKTIPILSIYAADIYMMFSLVTDYCLGKYTAVPSNDIVSILACCLYFLDSKEVYPDISNEVVDYDDITVFAWAVKQSREDIMQYSRWISYSEQFVSMG